MDILDDSGVNPYTDVLSLDEYRKAFEMNRFEEMTYNEIAERTGVSPKTIAYRISQALKILRTKLKDYIPLLVWLLYEQTRS